MSGRSALAVVAGLGLLLSCEAACTKDKTLTRAVAQKILAQNAETLLAPIVEEYQAHIPLWNEGSRAGIGFYPRQKLLALLEGDGIIKRRYERNTGTWWEAAYDPVPEAVKLSGAAWDRDRGAKLSFPVATVSFGEVTGIRQEGTSATAEVEIVMKPSALFTRIRGLTSKLFKSERLEPGPFRFYTDASTVLYVDGEMDDIFTRRHTRSYEFSLYDDGWRLSKPPGG